MARYKRRNYFTKKGFQSRFILGFLAVSSLAIVASISIFIWIADRKIEAVLYSMIMPAAIMDAFFFKAVLVANITAIGLVVIMFVLTAKIIYRMVINVLTSIQYGLREVQEGNLRGKIYLRAGDEFKDFAEQINAMTAELNQRFSEIRCHALQLDRRVKDLTWVSEEKDKKLLKGMLRNHITAIEDQLKTFKK